MRRRHHRLLSAAAFALLALVAELAGRSLTHRLDVGRHVASPANTQTDYYPILLAAVKVGIALLLARLAWRLVRARSASRAAARLAGALESHGGSPVPRLRLRLSPRRWLAFYALTAVIYLVQLDVEGMTAGRWPLLSPWLHSSALPIFAVVAVFAALLWSIVSCWLSEYEHYAAQAVAHARRLAAAALRVALPEASEASAAPRRLFGIVFESRPPPAPA